MPPLPNERQLLRERFIRHNGWAQASITPLLPDASFRCYFRLERQGASAMLMDAPPATEKIMPFIDMAHHLNKLGFAAPKIYCYDNDNGFVLMEDFGEQTFTRLLSADTDELVLYYSAVDVLISLHKHPTATRIQVPQYDLSALLNEALLLADWYYPVVQGRPIDPSVRDAYICAWKQVLTDLPATPETLVLRDFHVDNLVRIPAERDDSRCGLLDFQDAVIGPRAYDLVSLLEDARRAVATDVAEAALHRYLTAMSDIEPEIFITNYRVLGVQRHCKVAGIFTRLEIRDGKHVYRKHLPRVLRLLAEGLAEPLLAPVDAWLRQHLPQAIRPSGSG